jgi:glucokinase
VTRPTAAVGCTALVLDIGGTKFAAAVGDANGDLRRVRVAPTSASDGGVRVLERAIALAQEVLVQEREAGGDVAALGVSTMGLTRADHVDLAPNVPGWSGLAIPATLAEAFTDLVVTVGNDVKAATLAELYWGALVGVEQGIYLNLGTGVAAGLVVGGQLVDGAHGAAGEIGYFLLRGADEPLMAADGAAPAEEALGGRGVESRARSILGRSVTVGELMDLAPRDERARQLADEVWDGIAALIANLAIVCDPEVIVVGGGYVRSGDAMLERVTEIVNRATPFPPDVTVGHFRADASLYGALALAQRESFGRVVPSREGCER